MAVILSILFAVWLAYGNGACDNFKGAATLYGQAGDDRPGAIFFPAGRASFHNS